MEGLVSTGIGRAAQRGFATVVGGSPETCHKGLRSQHLTPHPDSHHPLSLAHNPLPPSAIPKRGE